MVLFIEILATPGNIVEFPGGGVTGIGCSTIIEPFPLVVVGILRVEYILINYVYYRSAN